MMGVFQRGTGIEKRCVSKVTGSSTWNDFRVFFVLFRNFMFNYLALVFGAIESEALGDSFSAIPFTMAPRVA